LRSNSKRVFALLSSASDMMNNVDDDSSVESSTS
jgi:hypothetical protein